MIVVVCGVSGTGKTTIGRLLAEELELSFYDADDFHSASNIEKMASGIPLSDDDRKPWLETLSKNLSGWNVEGGAVLACSALKESYRAALGSQFDGTLVWVVLTASEALLKERMLSRSGHFFDQRLLSSQLQDFELPDYGFSFDVSASPTEIVKGVVAKLR